MNNQKGQAILEGILALVITIPMFIFFIFSLMFISLDICINDALDSFLFCKVQSKKLCVEDLEKNTVIKKIKQKKITYHQDPSIHGDMYKIKLRGLILNQYQYTKERKFIFQKNI